MKQTKAQNTSYQIPNSQIRDSSSKIIFGDSHLCSQFLHGYENISLLKDVEPEDIEDVSKQYIHMFIEKRNSDVVKEAFSGRVKERHMGELFANFEAYDVQETRRIEREEVREEYIARAIRMMKEVSGFREITKQQLIKQFELSPEEAEEKLKLYWLYRVNS